jgi:hypothetical protein
LFSKREDIEDIQKAEEMFTRVLSGREKVLGLDNPYTLMTMNNLAIVLEQQDKLEEAEDLFRRRVKGREKVLGANHPDTIAATMNLASLMKLTGKAQQQTDTIQVMMQSALNRSEAVLGAQHPFTVKSARSLGSLIGGKSKSGSNCRIIQPSSPAGGGGGGTGDTINEDGVINSSAAFDADHRRATAPNLTTPLPDLASRVKHHRSRSFSMLPQSPSKEFEVTEGNIIATKLLYCGYRND